MENPKIIHDVINRATRTVYKYKNSYQPWGVIDDDLIIPFDYITLSEELIELWFDIVNASMPPDFCAQVMLITEQGRVLDKLPSYSNEDKIKRVLNNAYCSMAETGTPSEWVSRYDGDIRKYYLEMLHEQNLLPTEN